MTTNHIELKATMYEKLLALASVIVMSVLLFVPGANALQSNPIDPMTIVGFAVSPSNPQYATVRRNGAVEITNTQTGDVMGPYFVPLPFQDISNLRVTGNNVRDIAYSPDGSQIAITVSDISASGHVYVLEWDNEQIRQVHSESNIDMINDMSWSPDGSHMVLALQYGGADQLIRTRVQILDVDSGGIEQTLAEYYPTDNYAFGVVDWSPSGVVAYANRSLLILWDANTNTDLGTSAASDLILDAAWSPDSQRIATLNSDSTIQIWRADSGLSSTVFALPVEQDRLRSRHMTWLTNNLLAVDVWTNIYVWDVTSASLEETIDAGNAFVIGMGVNTDGKFAYATGSQLIDIVPIPSPTPSPTPTPSATPTPAAFQRLRVTAICSDDPATSRRWRIRNPNPYPVPFTWEMHNSPSGQQGTGTAPVAVNGVPSAVILTTPTERWIPVIEVTANGRSDLAINLGIPCAWP